jgi:competence protein ComEA
MSKNVEKHIDLNSAAPQDLERIQTIGREQTRKILEYRTQHGEFKSWDDVKKVPGMTNEMVDSLRRSGFTVNGRAA